MSTAALLENNKLVLRAYATLVDAAPNHNDYNAHLQFIQDFGKEHYVNTLNQAFASYSDEQLATSLLQSTGLNGIDLEGDGNIDNMGLATQFIRAHAGNRVKAILDLSEQLSTITTGPLGGIAFAFNEKLEQGYDYADDSASTQPVYYNDNYQIRGTAGNDTIYANNNEFGTYSFGGETIKSKAIWVLNTANQNTANNAQKLTALQGGTPTTVGSYGVKVQVGYHGVFSRAIAIDDQVDYQANQHDINQAIKQAVNGDAVLSQLLEAVDGPNGTLGLLAKVDGNHGTASISVRLIAPGADALSPDVVQAFIAHNPGTTVHDAASLLQHIQSAVTGAEHTNSLRNQFYATAQLGHDDLGHLVNGRGNVTIRDHIIETGAGDDVIVLGKAHRGILPHNNDTVQYTGAFGHDTLVNFDYMDRLDFTLLHRTSYDVPTTSSFDWIFSSEISGVRDVVDGYIQLEKKQSLEGITAALSDNDSAEDIRQLFNDGNIYAKQLYIAVDQPTQTGDVYQIIDGTASNDLSVQLLGRITLAETFETNDSPWSIVSFSGML